MINNKLYTRITEGFEQLNREPLNNGGSENRSSERIEEKPIRLKPGPKKRLNGNSRKQVTFKWSWEIEKRLGLYLVNRNYEERRDIDRSEVVEKAVDEFLTKEGY